MKTHYSRIALGTLISAISLSIASPAFAQFAKPEDAVKYRQSTFALMGAHMGRLAAVVKGETPYNKDNVVIMQPLLACYLACHGKRLALAQKVVKPSPIYGQTGLSSNPPLRRCKQQ